MKKQLELVLLPTDKVKIGTIMKIDALKES